MGLTIYSMVIFSHRYLDSDCRNVKTNLYSWLFNDSSEGRYTTSKVNHFLKSSLHNVNQCLYKLFVSTGVANRNNPVTQNKIAEEGAIGTLVGLLRSSSNPLIKVEIAIALGAITLGNRGNQKMLEEEPMFDIQLLLQLLHERDMVGLESPQL